MIKKIKDYRGKHKTYSDKEGFVICEYNRSTNKFNYTLKIECLRITTNFSKLKEVKQYLKEESIDRKIQPYYKMKKILKNNGYKEMSNTRLNSKTIEFMRDPIKQLFRYIKYKENINKENLLNQIHILKCEKGLIQELQKEIDALKKEKNETISRMEDIQNQPINFFDFEGNITKKEIEGMGVSFFDFLDKNSLEDLKKKVKSITKEAKEEHLEAFRKDKLKSFKKFKNSNSHWREKGLSFLSEISGFLLYTDNKKAKELHKSFTKKRTSQYKKRIQSLSKKINKYQTIVEEIK